MKTLCWILALSVGFGASGCRSITYVPLAELSEDEAAQLDSAGGLSVAGYRTTRGTTFKDRGRAHRVPGGIRFTPDKKTRLFPGPVTVCNGQIKGVGRKRTDAGKTVLVILLAPIAIVALIVTAAYAVEQDIDFETTGGGG